MTGDDAKARVAKARAAQEAWSSLPVRRRVRGLRSVRWAIAGRMDEIVRTICEETGKPAHDALTGDVMVTLEHFRFAERHAGRVLRDRRVGKPAFFYQGTRFAEILEPHGVVLVFAPANYPLQLALIPATTALAAGNAVLLKCSERTPRVAALIRDLWRKSGMPEDVLQVSCEDAAGGAALIEGGPDFIFFTGSSANGRAVAEHAARHMVPCVFELGGKDPALVFSSCDVDRTVNGLVYGAFANGGRVCMGTRRIYVERAIYERFLAAFVERARRLTVEDIGSTGDLTQLREKLGAAGGTVHACGLATVVSELAANSPYFEEEIFAPVVSISPFADEAEGLRLANASPFALAASIWTSDARQAQRLARSVDAGAVAINDVIRNVGNPYASFGGNKQSGYGRYRGDAGFRAFSRTRSIMTVDRPQGKERHWIPLGAKTVGVLRGLLLLRHAGGSLWQRLRGLQSRKEG